MGENQVNPEVVLKVLGWFLLVGLQYQLPVNLDVHVGKLSEDSSSSHLWAATIRTLWVKSSLPKISESTQP